MRKKEKEKNLMQQTLRGERQHKMGMAGAASSGPLRLGAVEGS